MSTQKELARLAGVSSGTVSNVISGTVPVSEHLRQKVLRAIQAVDYHPNLIARSLKTNRTQTIGIVVPDITVPFFPKVIRGAERAARDRGYSVIVVESEGSHTRETELLRLLRSQRVDGILLVVAGAHRRPAESRALLGSGPPIVCLDRLPDGLNVDSVCVDDRNAAEMAIAHLVAMGHRRIAVISGPLALKNEEERLRGYRQALQKSGLPVREALIWTSSFHREEIISVCQRGLLNAGNRPSALFSTNGVTGLGALRGIFAAGLSTPGDIAFVTFDELTADGIFRPAITTVVQPANEIGSRGMEILISRIGEDTPGGARKRVRLPARLVVRESSNFPYQAKSK